MKERTIRGSFFHYVHPLSAVFFENATSSEENSKDAANVRKRIDYSNLSFAPSKE
jgi:hypothetical protein